MIEDYFTDEIVIISQDIDQDQNVTQTENSHRCRVDFTEDMIKGADGNETQASYRIYLSYNTTVGLNDRVRITYLRGVDTEITKEFPILTKSRHAGFDENHIRLTV